MEYFEAEVIGNHAEALAKECENKEAYIRIIAKREPDPETFRRLHIWAETYVRKAKEFREFKDIVMRNATIARMQNA